MKDALVGIALRVVVPPITTVETMVDVGGIKGVVLEARMDDSMSGELVTESGGTL